MTRESQWQEKEKFLDIVIIIFVIPAWLLLGYFLYLIMRNIRRIYRNQEIVFRKKSGDRERGRRIGKYENRAYFISINLFIGVIVIAFGLWIIWFKPYLGASLYIGIMLIFISVFVTLYVFLLYHYWRLETDDDEIVYFDVNKTKLQDPRKAKVIQNFGNLGVYLLFVVILIFFLSALYPLIEEPENILEQGGFPSQNLSNLFLALIAYTGLLGWYRQLNDYPEMTFKKVIGTVVALLFISISGFYVYQSVYLPYQTAYTLKQRFNMSLPPDSKLIEQHASTDGKNIYTVYQLTEDNYYDATNVGLPSNDISNIQYSQKDMGLSNKELQMLEVTPYFSKYVYGKGFLYVFYDSTVRKLYVIELLW